MNTKSIFFALLALAVPVFADEPIKKDEASKTNAVEAPRWPALKTEKEKVSYAIGFDMAGFHMAHRDELDKERMIQGFRDAFDAKKPIMEYDEAKELMEKFEKEMNALEKKTTELEGVKNRRIGAKFLEENQKKEGVKVTASGLQYKVIKEGTGATPVATDRVRFHYVVKGIEGNLLDDSHRLPKPIGSHVRSLMKGWQEGLQLMKEGAVYEFYIAPELAYGEQGAGRNIKANETLVTELELVGIEK
ncbi:MAG: peptidylprolyl cis-trans isomerase, FKBP-type [Verrucomicrobiales bacterium]|nr:peptidylprolyl cis-trans isomerase, FKBP-type [Verrucomicrobiales bacterium]